MSQDTSAMGSEWATLEEHEAHAQSKRTARSKQINIRLNQDEATRLAELAAYHDRTAADMVRRLIRLEYERVIQRRTPNAL